jgi:signal transduction histidine kinase
VAAAAGAAVLVVAFGIVLTTGSTAALGHLAAPAFGFGVAWVLGDRTRNRRAYLAELEERAARLQRERAEHARRAAEAERIGIARELHDVVVHNVSVIAVQAGAARATSHGDADRATAALGLIERTARATLTELRALLGVLRRQDQDDRSGPVLAPQPSLANLDRLLGQAREGGVHVDARVEGAARPLPATVDLAAYRIVQEALTNVMKHAPGARVHLLVSRGDRAIDLVVVDDGPGAPPNPSGGQGLIGMRERAALVSGHLTAGPALGGGFRVQAQLPVESPGCDHGAPDADETPAEARLP